MKNSFIVTGLPRSGTSIVARLLLDNADSLTSELDFFSADAGNPDGYFELREIVKINNQILYWMNPHANFLNPPGGIDLLKAGEKWLHRHFLNEVGILSPDNDRTGPWSTAGIDTVKSLSYVMDKIQISSFAHHPFLIKDPRFIYTLPFWEMFLEHLQGDVMKLVIVHRGQKNVRASHRKLYGIFKGVDVDWNGYKIPACSWNRYHSLALLAQQQIQAMVPEKNIFQVQYELLTDEKHQQDLMEFTGSSIDFTKVRGNK